MKARIRKLADKRFVAEITWGLWPWNLWWVGCDLQRETTRDLGSNSFRGCVGDYGQCLEELHNRGFATKDIAVVF